MGYNTFSILKSRGGVRSSATMIHTVCENQQRSRTWASSMNYSQSGPLHLTSTPVTSVLQGPVYPTQTHNYSLSFTTSGATKALCGVTVAVTSQIRKCDEQSMAAGCWRRRCLLAGTDWTVPGQRSGRAIIWNTITAFPSKEFLI